MKLSWLKLAWIAAICVIKTMREGQKHYPDERWKIQPINAHVVHAKIHIFDFMDNFGDQPKEDHIAHMITRGAMIKYLEE